MDKDIITKKTVKILLKDLARHILGLEVSNISFIDKELQRIEKREADIVAQCKIEGKEEILHIEIQNDYDKTMPNRMARYYLDINLVYPNIPIRQYLIYIGRQKCYLKDHLENNGMSYRYTLIDMHNIDCDKFIEMDTPDALVLSILCDFKGRDEFDIITYILNRLHTLLKDGKRRREYIEILEILSKNRNLENKIKEAEEMIRTTRYDELPSYEIGFERGLINGIEQGIEKGIEKGIAEGIEKGKREERFKSMAIMIKKFGLPVEQIAKEYGVEVKEIQEYIEKNKI